MKVLVTGCSGFIGTHLVRSLADRGYAVSGADIDPPAPGGPGCEFFRCDVTDGDGLRRALTRSRPDAVVHLAARTDLDGRSVGEYRANVEGTRQLVAAVAATASIRRCIYTSTQLVCRVGHLPAGDREFCPDTAYGESKAQAETIVRELDGGGKEWCLARPTTVWGPGMNRHYLRFFRLLLRGRYFFVGRRPLFKSYGYVGNVVHQYCRLLEAPQEQVQRKVLYLADYEPISLRAWVEAFQRELGARAVPTVPIPAARAMARLGDLVNAFGFRSFPFNSFRLNNILTEYRFDLSATERVCGPLPCDMQQGVRETSAWVRREIPDRDSGETS
jgi:nucleoside-diphosphate-sugar epimerase